MPALSYNTSVSTSATPPDTYNTVTDSIPDPVNTDVANLSPDNYPEPIIDKDGYPLPNTINQAIFMNQPLSWWCDSLNNEVVQYRPVSNTVNWAFVDSSGNDIHIRRDISDIIIPNRTSSFNYDISGNLTTIVYRDNNCILMTSTSSGFRHGARG